jgi:hypothetical protein
MPPSRAPDTTALRVFDTRGAPTFCGRVDVVLSAFARPSVPLDLLSLQRYHRRSRRVESSVAATRRSGPDFAGGTQGVSGAGVPSALVWSRPTQRGASRDSQDACRRSDVRSRDAARPWLSRDRQPERGLPACGTRSRRTRGSRRRSRRRASAEGIPAPHQASRSPPPSSTSPASGPFRRPAEAASR